VTADQHKEFFGHVTGLDSAPLLTLHYRAEGRHEYTVLLYVPADKPYDLYDPERRGRQKLYVRRVYISDDARMLPSYLRFVRGVVDSEDMPLNISREMLQDNPQVAGIRKGLTGRVIAELKKCADSDAGSYGKIWQAFGPVIKEGLYEDFENRDKLYEIARFCTTAAPAVSLKDYVAGMKENQTAIYYLTTEDAAKAEKSPQLEGFRARGVEVLLLTDPVDSFWVRTALGYEGKPFTSVTQGATGLDLIPLKDGATAAADDEGATATLIALLKQSLGAAVSDVRKSARLTGSAVCLVAGEGGLDRNLEKILLRQKTADITATAPVLEVNPSHPLIAKLARTAKSGGASAEIETAAHLLLDQARILEGEPVNDPAAFAERLQKLMERSLMLSAP
jgi:molecular chaperone HtpG